LDDATAPTVQQHKWRGERVIELIQWRWWNLARTLGLHPFFKKCQPVSCDGFVLDDIFQSVSRLYMNVALNQKVPRGASGHKSQLRDVISCIV